MRKELITTNDWKKDLLNIIDWEAFGFIFCAMEMSCWIQMSKINYGMLPIKRQTLWFEYSTPNVCPTCNNDNEEETITHMMQCQIHNTVAWKPYLQESLIKSGLGPQN